LYPGQKKSAEFPKHAPMPAPEFKPGFRLSAFDALLLVAGGLAAWWFWPRTWWLGLVIAWVVGHFFLFCNVFRISRGLELIWAAAFVVLTRLTVANGYLSWTTTMALSTIVAVVVIAIELKKPSYHGVAWSRLNPNLRHWWDSHLAREDESSEHREHR
jgi:hypothetical protein